MTHTTVPNSSPKAICVYCGSSTKVHARYLQTAAQTGRLIAQAGYTLVWGGGSVGLMGALADGAANEGGQLLGVIPHFLANTEVAYTMTREQDRLIVTPDMRTRKHKMETSADAYLVLPGGLGTLEEMFEILTLRLLKQHNKILVLLNDNGFYDPLLHFLEHLYTQGFARQASRSHYVVVQTPEQAIVAIQNDHKSIQ